MGFVKELSKDGMLSWARCYKVLLLALMLLVTAVATIMIILYHTRNMSNEYAEQSVVMPRHSWYREILSHALFYILYLLTSGVMAVILFATMKFCKELVVTNRELVEIQKEICKQVKLSLATLRKDDKENLILALTQNRSARKCNSNIINTRHSRRLIRWNRNTERWRNTKKKWKREIMFASHKKWEKNKPYKAQVEMENNKECEECLEEEQSSRNVNGMNTYRQDDHHHHYNNHTGKSDESSSIVIFSPTSQHDKDAVESTHSSKYRIVCPIGHGSFGSVYLVEHKQTGCTFALKYIVCANDTRRSAALHEVETMNAVQGHPNIIKIIDMFMNYEFYSVSAINTNINKAKLPEEKELEGVDKVMNDVQHMDVSAPTHFMEQKKLESTSVAVNNVIIDDMNGENKTKDKKKTAAHWAYLHLPVKHVSTTTLEKSLEEEEEEYEHQSSQLLEKAQLVVPAVEHHIVEQNNNIKTDANGKQEQEELFMSSKFLSEADTECLMREAELVLRNVQNNNYHFTKPKDVNTNRPRKAEEVVSLLTHTSASHVKLEPTQNTHVKIHDDSNNIEIKENNTSINQNYEPLSDKSEQNKEKLMLIEIEKEAKQIYESKSKEKECDSNIIVNVHNSNNNNNNDKSTSESNNSRQLFRERTKNIEWNTKLRHGATIAPPPTSYAPRRVRYVDFTYPTFAHNAQNNKNSDENNKINDYTENIEVANISSYNTKSSNVCTVEQSCEELEKESKQMCTEDNDGGKKELTSKMSDRAHVGDDNKEDVVEVISTNIPNTSATHSQNHITYCNAHAHVRPSQNIAITHYRNFTIHKLSTRDSSSKSNQTANFTSQSDETGGKKRRITSKQAQLSPHMCSIHSNVLHTNSSRQHTAQTPQASFGKVFDDNNNAITHNAISTPSNKTFTTNTTSTTTYTNHNNNKTVSVTGNSNARRSRHGQAQLTIQHIHNDTTNNQEENSSKLSSSVLNKHPGCLCLVMEYHPLGDLAHYVLRQRELIHQGHEATSKINPLSEPQLLSIAYQLSSVLQYLHSRNPVIIHRDLKPENILIKGDAVELLSSTEQIAVDASSLSLISGRITQKIIPVVVTDFGLAITQEYSEEEMEMLVYGETTNNYSNHLRHCHRRTGKGGGTRPYISPESWLGQTTMASDMWSLGCVLYALATCRIAASNVRIMSVEAKKPDFANMILNDILQHNYSLMFGSFVLSLLVLDPSKRLSASSALRCFTIIKKSNSSKCHVKK